MLFFFVALLLASHCASQSILTLIGDRCVTNTSSAIGAIYDVSVINRTGECGAEDVTYVDENTDVGGLSHWWRKYHSFEKIPYIDNLITDQKWEEFPLYSTQYVDEKLTLLQYYLVDNITSVDFQIPFSVQIDENAHVLLCNGPVISSHCFWFILSEFTNYGVFLVFRTCNPREVPEYFNQKVLEGCHSSTETLKMPYELSSTKWSHFKIVKTDSFVEVIDRNGNTLFKKLDNYENFRPTRVFIHSTKANGFWKIHDFKYHYTQDVNKALYIYPPEKETCFSMYTHMCRECYLEIVEQNIKLYNNQRKWQRVSEHVYEKFWAVRDLKTLKSNLRYIKPDRLLWKNACQHMETGSILDDSRGASLLSPSCKVNEFGDDCFSCAQIFNQSCPEEKYCYLTSLSQTQCVCPIGRKGLNCDENCFFRSYGPGCRNDCGNCQDGCNPKNGICKSSACHDNYSGKKCDQPPGFFIFHNSPIIEEGYEGVIVSMGDFQGDGDVKKIEFYLFQYKPVDSKSWNTTRKIPFGQTVKMEIKDLHKQTEYNLRVFGVDHDFDKNKQSFVLHDMKTYNFSTKCDVLKRDDISLEVGRTYVIVIINNKYLCQRHILNLMINKVPIGSIEKNVGFNITKLKPYTNYSLVASQLNVTLNTTFQTLEDKPGVVQNFKALEKNSEISLSWKEPRERHGKLLFYMINVTSKTLLSCNDPISLSTSITMDASKIDFSFKDYEPYSRYSFAIRVNNSWGFGDEAVQHLTTKYSDKLTINELPSLKQLTIGSRNVIIYFDHIGCDYQKGPLSANFRVISSVKRCDENSIRLENIRDIVTLDYLSEFCPYNLTIDYSRPNSAKFQTQNYTFRTLDGVPNDVIDASVTSKGSESVSLRWRPSKQTNGDLEEFSLCIVSCNPRYWTTSSNHCENTILCQRAVADERSLCPLWQDFYCAQVMLPKREYIYHIKIKAKNRNNPQDSNGTSLKFKAIESEPGEPQNLTVSWTNDNSLIITWYHPIVANGVLTGFDIIVKVGLDRVAETTYNLNSREDYQSFYSETIPESALIFPAKYTVELFSKNHVGKSKTSAATTFEGPPPIPRYEINATKRSEDIIVEQRSLMNSSHTYQMSMFILIPQACYQSCEHDLSQLSESIQTNPYNLDDWTIVYQNDSFVETILIEDKIRTDPEDLGFIWVHKHSNYTRTNHVMKSVIKEKEKFIGVTIIIGVLLMMLFFVAIVLGFSFRETIKTHAIDLTDRLCTLVRRSGEVEDQPMPIRSKTFDQNKEMSRSRHYSVRRPLSRVSHEEFIVPGVPTFKTKHSRRIKIDNLQEYVKKAIHIGELDEQHGVLPRGQTQSWSYGSLEQNKRKNRYRNVVAYDHSRVILDKLVDDPYSDYINANYIDGYLSPRAYIATQGPKSNTVVDFWRMIWQEKVSHIVMMANIIENNKKKIEQYWPESGEVVYGDYQVMFLDSEPHVFFDVRRLELRYKMTRPRNVVQIQFKAWPDHGIPLYTHSLVTLLQKLLTLKSTDFPIVVHCSAGVGRTGTVILCDILLRMAAAEGSIDPLSMFEHLRSQRPNMVDNSLQYKYAHLVLVDCLTAMNTSMKLHELENWMDRVNVGEQLNYINDCQWQNACLKDMDVPEPPDAMDACIVENRYIVTQYPNSITISDFWRLIINSDIHVVVCLNDIDQNFLTPVSKNLQVLNVKTRVTTFYKVHNLEVEWQLHNTPQKKMVQALQFNGWRYGELPGQEEFIDGFLAFVEYAITYGRSSEKVLISCLDGVLASGIFLTMTFLIEQIKLEGMCDVCQAVRSVRHGGGHFINNEEQLTFLYRCCSQYIKERYSIYSN